MTLVRKIDGGWQEWHGDATVTVQVATMTARYHDGRVDEVACDPYPVERTLNGERLARLHADGVWSLGEVEAVGGRIAQAFVVPQGKRIIGPARYVESKGAVRQVHDVEDIPPAPPPTTPEEKLAAIGLTRDDLKALLADGAVEAVKV